MHSAVSQIMMDVLKIFIARGTVYTDHEIAEYAERIGALMKVVRKEP